MSRAYLSESNKDVEAFERLGMDAKRATER